MKIEEKNKRRFIFAAVALAFLLGLFAGCLIAKKEKFSGGVEYSARPFDNVSESEALPEQGVTIPGMTALTIPAGQTRVRFDFFNPTENSGLYYLTFELDVYINGKPETLYSSGLVEAGKRLEEITLLHPLEAGEYSAAVHIQPYRISDNSPTNNADIMLKLTAK